MTDLDYVVVGSGCAGAMAAQTLVERGARVTMVDVGMRDTQYASLIPDIDYITIRRTEADQYRFLIGDRGEGLAFGEVSKGAQLTPPRHYMSKDVDRYIPVSSTTFSPLESLGYGGLGIGWGLQCWEFSSLDLQRTGLNAARMSHAYEIVSQRIGISATADAAAKYTLGQLTTYQPSANMDRNHRLLYRHYTANADKFQRHGFYVGRTPLALITKDISSRQGYRYRDMDFYDDKDLSAWRPWITVDSLRNQANFRYVGNHLVTRFEENKAGVILHCLDISNNNKPVVMRCKRLILASSALGSARIVLRSVGNGLARLPLLSNPHSYIPCIQPQLVGQGVEPGKLGFGQLSYFIDEEGGDNSLSIASSYGYQSLMLFRIVNQAPIDFASSRILMRYLMTGLVIMIVQHPDSPSAAKYLRLASDSTSPTGDKLMAHYELTHNEEAMWNKREKQYVAAMRSLRAFAPKRVKTKHGSSIHYAGTLPFSDREREMTLSPNGRLHGTRNVYVADSSGFNYLPAKGLTFSLLANAHLIAENALHHA